MPKSALALAQDIKSPAIEPIAPAQPAGSAASTLEFIGVLARKHLITGDLLTRFVSAEHAGAERKLRDLWPLTDLSASDFADEVARFYKLPRLALPQLLAATSLAGRFSQRFLRKSAVYPCRPEEGAPATLAVADPTDTTTRHAAELVLGRPITVVVASFEDIATVLSERIGADAPAASPRAILKLSAAKRTSKAFAIWPAAPLWCAPSTTSWRKR